MWGQKKRKQLHPPSYEMERMLTSSSIKRTPISPTVLVYGYHPSPRTTTAFTTTTTTTAITTTTETTATANTYPGMPLTLPLSCAAHNKKIAIRSIDLDSYRSRIVVQFRTRRSRTSTTTTTTTTK